MYDFENPVDMPVRDAEIELHALDQPPLTSTVTAPPQRPAGFQMPSSVWLAMFVCYAVFFAAIWVATGGSGPARFAIVISILYTAMYFGCSAVLAAQAGPEAPSPLERGEPLQTQTGPMGRGTVFAQMLVIPVAVAGFGVAIAIITALQ